MKTPGRRRPSTEPVTPEAQARAAEAKKLAALGLSRPQLTVLEREMQRASPLYFAVQNLTGPPEAPYNGRFLAGEHHYEWDDLVVKGRRLCILAARDHGKSMYFNKAVPIWKGMYGSPGEIGYIFSANQERAIEMLEAIVSEITTNPKLQHLAPRDWEQKWSKRRIKLTTGVEIRARGFGVKVRGGHPHWVICDDVLSDETLSSETIRNKAIEFFLSAITNMVVPGGQIIVVGTPFHGSDLYAVLKKNAVYSVWQKPAIDRKTGKALWPARYNKKLLEERRAEIGSVRFTREFMCEPFSDEMSLFPSYLFEGKPVQQYQITLGNNAAYWDALGITARFMGVDIAISASTGADYLVIFTLGKDKDGNRWVCDIVRRKGLGFQAQLDLINARARLLEPSLIFIEANQMQRVWGDELIRTTDLPIKKFITTGVGKGKSPVGSGSQTQNKHNLEKGIPSLVPLLENKKYRIPRGDAYSVEMTDIWISEMQSMSFVDGEVKCVGDHDDSVFSNWIAEQALRRGGFSASFGPDGDNALQQAAHAAMGRAPELGAGKTKPLGDDEQPKASGNLGAADSGEGALWTARPFFGG